MKKLVKLFDKTGNELVPDNIKNTKSKVKQILIVVII